MQNIELPLGKYSEYKDQYDNNLLVRIPRSLARNELNLPAILPFNGYDIWSCYEASWLNIKGKPVVRILRFIVAADSEYILESKSVKLYLNSLNGTRFASEAEVLKALEKDLSWAANSKVSVDSYEINSLINAPLTIFDGTNIDDLDAEISEYQVNPNLLELSAMDEIVEETLYSNLLKSNCLVTNQQDWASVQIKYKGKKINHESLLKYLISFRNHNEFHEQCIENIFNDIRQRCMPLELTVYAKYTRRGGIDISPYRTNLNLEDVKINMSRDVRQ